VEPASALKPTPENSVAARLAAAKHSIEEAIGAAGRTDSVRLVAVSKGFPSESVQAAYSEGHREFGENRVQEAMRKRTELDGLAPAIVWHLIGHLQTNKAKSAVKTFQMIQSIDSAKLAESLALHAGNQMVRMPVLLEVNVAGEASKSGFAPEQLALQAEHVLSLPNIDPRGLMTVAPVVDDPKLVAPVFARLRELRDEIRERFRLPRFSELSMGMSDDYAEAIRQGATIVRLGRAIFGERAGNR
jgi:pyridoxal phosphate enzyme (YggS family)